MSNYSYRVCIHTGTPQVLAGKIASCLNAGWYLVGPMQKSHVFEEYTQMMTKKERTQP